MSTDRSSDGRDPPRENTGADAERPRGPAWIAPTENHRDPQPPRPTRQRRIGERQNFAVSNSRPRWRKGSHRPRKPTGHAALDIQRTVGPLGVMVNCLLYDSPALRAARKTAGGTLRVGILVDPSDLGEVVASLPDGTFIRLEAVNSAYARCLTLHAHWEILRVAGTKVPGAKQPWTKDGIERFFSAFRHQLAGMNEDDGEGRS